MEKIYNKPKYSIGDEAYAVIEEPKQDGGITFTIMDFVVRKVGIDIDKDGKEMIFYGIDGNTFGGIVESCVFNSYESAFEYYVQKRSQRDSVNNLLK